MSSTVVPMLPHCHGLRETSRCGDYDVSILVRYDLLIVQDKNLWSFSCLENNKDQTYTLPTTDIVPAGRVGIPIEAFHGAPTDPEEAQRTKFLTAPCQTLPGSSRAL